MIKTVTVTYWVCDREHKHATEEGAIKCENMDPECFNSKGLSSSNLKGNHALYLFIHHHGLEDIAKRCGYDRGGLAREHVLRALTWSRYMSRTMFKRCARELGMKKEIIDIYAAHLK